MDKVMIDGVDVSECKHHCLEDEIPEIPLAGKSSICGEEYIARYCAECPNCYYKQLQRARAEIEELKLENEKLKKQYNCYACDTCGGKEDYRNMRRHCENAITSLHNVRAENEKLKEGITKLQDPRYQIAKVNEGYYNRMIKYRQCLKEIKEIVKNCDNGKCFSCEYNQEMAENCIDKLHNKILDKISEVLDDKRN